MFGSCGAAQCCRWTRISVLLLLFRIFAADSRIIMERGVSPLAGSIPSPSPDALSVPVAFPIYRPRSPSSALQRHHTEDIRHSAVHPTASNFSASDVEEISVPSSGTSSDDDEEQSSQQQETAEDLAFRPVPIPAQNNNSDTQTFPKLEEQRNSSSITGGGTGSTTKRAAAIGGLAESTLSPVASGGRRKDEPTQHPSSTIRTPQFPVFTGMEIIESNESGAESAASEDGQHHRMHYNRADNNNINGTQQPNLSTSADNTPATKVHFLQNATWTTSAAGGAETSSTKRPGTIRIEKIKMAEVTNANTATLSTTHSAHITAGTVPSEVTEDLLAVFSATLAPHQFPASSERGNNNDELDNGFERRTELIPSPIGTTQQQPEREEVITRPTRPSSTASGEHQNGDAHVANSTASTRPSAQFPLFWSSSSSPSPTTASTTTTTAMVSNVDDNDVVRTSTNDWRGLGEEELAGRRITVGTKRVHTTTAVATPHFGENNNVEEDTTENAEWTTHTPPATQQHSLPPTSTQPRNRAFGTGKEEELDNHLGGDSAPVFPKPAPSSMGASLRLLFMTGVIAVLLIAIVVGSMCTGRYVRKSRQLHGKYRPAAYEMQTTRPPPLAMAYPFSVDEHNSPSHQQQQQHFQTVDYMHHHNSHLPLQVQQNGIINGKEERLI